MKHPAVVLLVLLLPVALASATPAARLGDPTSHGGVVIAGSPTVFMGGLPAARVGDFATCPLFLPGDPPIPHVGGPIVLGTPTVLIDGRPAARVGDQVVEVAGQSVIAGGAPTVSIGSSSGRQQARGRRVEQHHGTARPADGQRQR